MRKYNNTQTIIDDRIINIIVIILVDFLSELEGIITQRKKMSEVEPELREDKNSYVVSLFDKGINKIAQKVGEEAVEVVIEAKDDDENLFLNESADLLFHYLILLRAKGYELKDIAKVLEEK